MQNWDRVAKENSRSEVVNTSNIAAIFDVPEIPYTVEFRRKLESMQYLYVI